MFEPSEYDLKARYSRGEEFEKSVDWAGPPSEHERNKTDTRSQREQLTRKALSAAQRLGKHGVYFIV